MTMLSEALTVTVPAVIAREVLDSALDGLSGAADELEGAAGLPQGRTLDVQLTEVQRVRQRVEHAARFVDEMGDGTGDAQVSEMAMLVEACRYVLRNLAEELDTDDVLELDGLLERATAARDCMAAVEEATR